VQRATNIAGRDATLLLERLGGDQYLLLNVTAIFPEESQRVLEDIEAGCSTRNAAEIEMAAHTLKGNITGSMAAPVDSSLSAILDAEFGSTTTA